MNDAAREQARYYATTAAVYDALHGREQGGHEAALDLISEQVQALGIRTILDVGSGTGRALRHFQARHPAVAACGVEPVWALIERARHDHGVAGDQIALARGEALPFADASFDAVCELGILHHVPDPNAVVREMLRVARRAVFLSDANRFGQGSWPARIAKLALHRARLWPLANYLKTGGRGYDVSPGDGLYYSYSVFDSYPLLRCWASRVSVIATSPPASTPTNVSPLLGAAQVLACAIRD